MEKVIFIDRDGVINRDSTDYVLAWSEFDFIPHVFEALRALTELGYKIIVVSNQAGIGKGLFTMEALAEITEKMLARIERNGGKIYTVHYCPHRDDEDCVCRKPKTGLFKQAVAGLAVDLRETFVVGDSERDIIAGKRMGCPTILVLCGKTKTREAVGNFAVRPDFIAEDLLDAVNTVIAVKERERYGNS
jgi:histidinol-phosphate phosphatase family domain/HAD-superfamily hydrolase, subfamily IIIA